MKRIEMAVLAALLSTTGAYSQTPNGPSQRDVPSTQTPASSPETTGAGSRSPQEIGPADIVPPDGATDRAPPSKLRPGELPPPQNPKSQ
jgi:hypothetical protein